MKQRMGKKEFSQHAPTCKYARWDYLGKKEIDNLVIDKIGIQLYVIEQFELKIDTLWNF